MKKKYDCGICCLPVTKYEIENMLAFDIKHSCGRLVWYHVTCAMEIVNKL